MRKTFCDKCKQECVNGVCYVNLRIEHTTRQGEMVGEDEYKPAELCVTCGTVAAEVLGMLTIMRPPRDRDEPVALAVPHIWQPVGVIAADEPSERAIERDTVRSHP